MRCGVLALQGDYDAHATVLAELGVEVVLVRTAAELDTVECLVFPGGESTAMLRLLEPGELGARLTERLDRGLPALATCAGVILLAKGVDPPQPSLGVLDVDVVRNAYGRQVHSRIVELEMAPELGEPRETEGVFIRAPRISRLGARVEVLARRGDDPVLVRQGRIIAATYHPELCRDRRAHRLLLAAVGGRNG